MLLFHEIASLTEAFIRDFRESAISAGSTGSDIVLHARMPKIAFSMRA
eukprot:COSAG01_NODE_410_length_17384_cov_20.323691_10_plen_48_part_00